MLSKEDLINKIKQAGYNYDLYNHTALFTVDESNLNRGKIQGTHTKNLFLKNKKNKFYLISCWEDSKI